MPETLNLELPDAEVFYTSKFFSEREGNHLFDKLLSEIQWQQDDITVFGKTYKQPRLTALYANNTNPYSYSNITMFPLRFNSILDEIRLKVESVTGHQFTSCLLNLYRDGNDSNGWHADNEKELGKNPVIASVTFGAERVFHFKHNNDTQLKHKLILEHGSLLLMKGTTQHYWKHQLPKTRKKIGKRINLTFRSIK